MTASFVTLPTFSGDGAHVHVVVETPRGSRDKFTFDETLQCFVWSAPLPPGLAFPFDFGFLPRTRGDDGDPLDVLLLRDEPTFAGCVVEARLVGVLRAVQRRGRGPTVRNDRFVAVPRADRSRVTIRSLRDVEAHVVAALETFFVAFGASRGKHVVFDGRGGPERARRLVRAGMRAFDRGPTPPSPANA